MKKIFGFKDESTQEAAIAVAQTNDLAAVQTPKKSLVYVQFPNIRKEYCYYNDRFALSVGDRVFVSGKLYGELGVVTNVNEHFRINTADYQIVLAKPDMSVRGHFHVVNDMVVSTDTNVTPDTFASWILPPPEPNAEAQQGEIVYGEGWSVILDALETEENITESKLKKAVDCCINDQVVYLSLQNGAGVAFINGHSWSKVEFRYDGERITDLYCDCLYPDPCLCKHQIAALLSLRMLLQSQSPATQGNFVALNKNYFLYLLSAGEKSISLG